MIVLCFIVDSQFREAVLREIPYRERGKNERQSENFGGGGGAPAIHILKSVIGTAGNPKKTLYKVVLFCCVFACL